MGVELRVHESSVNMVKPGQNATITVEAYPDTALQGKVFNVAPLPDPPHGWFDPSVKVYTTQITIDGAHDFLKPGMSAKVEILIEQLKNVLIVPIQVVANREGKKVCYVATPRRVQNSARYKPVPSMIPTSILPAVSEVGEDVLSCKFEI